MIEYYVGTEGPTINIESPKEVYEAIDIIHTQVMDAGLPEEILRILEETMEKLYDYA